MTDYENKFMLGDTLSTLKTLPDNLVNCGVTSPPYNKQEKQKGWLVKNVTYENSSDKLPESEYQKNQIEVLDEIFRITKAGGSFFYNHKLRWDRGDMFHPMDWLRKTKWSVKQEIIWDRTIAANIRGWRFWQVEERIYWLYKPIDNNKIGSELASRHAKLTSVWRSPPERKNPHPAPFPLWLPIRVIASQFATDGYPESGLVLDPYMGSGTAAVAAKFLGQKYLGIEISEAYIDHADQRIADYQSEQAEFDKEISQHQVAKTFKERKANKENTGKFRFKESDNTPRHAELPL